MNYDVIHHSDYIQKYFNCENHIYHEIAYDLFYRSIDFSRRPIEISNSFEDTVNGILDIFFVKPELLDLSIHSHLTFSKHSKYENLIDHKKRDFEVYRFVAQALVDKTEFSEQEILKKLTQSYYIILGFWQASRIPDCLIENSNDQEIHKQYLDYENDVREMISKIWEKE